MFKHPYFNSFAVHWDHHAVDSYQKYGNGTNYEDIRRYLNKVKPDFIQCHTIGCRGYANFPSEIAPVVPGLVGDPLRIWADAAKEEGIPFGCYVATFAAFYPKLVPQWRCKSADGKYSETFYCANGPWMDEFLIPLMFEIIDRYNPVHFWLDGVYMPREGGCSCDYCRSKYEEMFNEKFPEHINAANLAKLNQFQEISVDKAISHIAENIRKKNKDILLACNTIYFFDDLRKPVEDVDWLSWDAINIPNINQTSFEAAYLATIDKPGDIMVFDNAVAEYGTASASYVGLERPKTVEQMKMEASLLLAHGCRYHLFQSPQDDDSFLHEQFELACEISCFVRERAEWCIDNQSSSLVAIYASKADHDIESNPHYSPVRSIYRMLTQAHLPTDIISDFNLLSHIEQYHLIILPETKRLSIEVKDILSSYMQNGGQILWILSPDESKLSDDCVGENMDYCSNIFVGKKQEAPLNQSNKVSINFGKYKVPINGPVYNIGSNFEAVYSYAESNIPWFAKKAIGNGYLHVITFGMCFEFYQTSWPRLRDLLMFAVNNIDVDTSIFQFDAPAGIEVVVNKRESDMYIHFINVTPGNSFGRQRQNPPGPIVEQLFFESVPSYAGLSIWVRNLAEENIVIEMPSRRKLEHTNEGRGGRIKLPELQYHYAIKIVDYYLSTDCNTGGNM